MSDMLVVCVVFVMRIICDMVVTDVMFCMSRYSIIYVIYDVCIICVMSDNSVSCDVCYGCYACYYCCVW